MRSLAPVGSWHRSCSSRPPGVALRLARPYEENDRADEQKGCAAIGLQVKVVANRLMTDVLVIADPVYAPEVEQAQDGVDANYGEEKEAGAAECAAGPPG